MGLVNSTYLHKLACVYHKIDKRGMRIDEPKLAELRQLIVADLKLECDVISQAWGCPIYYGRDNAIAGKDSLNLNSQPGLLKKLKDLGFNVPKIRKKNTEGDFEFNESTNELALQRLFAETADPILKSLLHVRELVKIKSTYIDARLFHGIYYSNYAVAATVTGRRGSKKHIFQYGGNAQNFPKHKKLGKKFRECIIPRAGKVFFIVDQMQAEDWPVSALANNTHALDELRAGVDRHTKLASYIFGIPEHQVTKDSIERFLGKKSRHANNYGMRARRMSDQLAQLGFSISEKVCEGILKKVNDFDPAVDNVFHKYVRECLFKDRILRTPLGRERMFMGLRNNDNNYEIMNEAYSYIPQSTVGDNTGLAALYIDDFNDYVVNEAHDSLVQETPEDPVELVKTYDATVKAFDREITFYNGITIKIPIEGEIGYNLQNTVKIKDFTAEGTLKAWEEAKAKHYGSVNNQQAVDSSLP